MDVRHLRSFGAAAECGSFTGAAKQLHLTQAAISQHVAGLEKELQTQLFERKGRGVQLTDAGRQLHEYARKILSLIDEAGRTIGKSAPAVAGVLRIATSTVPAEEVVPELLAEFRKQCPQVRDSVVVSDSRLAIADVECGDADVGFVGEMPDSTTLEVQPVAEDDLVLVVANNHPMAKKASVSVTQMMEESLILRERGSGTRRCFERTLTEQGHSSADLNIALEVNSNDAIRAAVERGMGVAFLSRRAALKAGDLTIVNVRGFRPQRQLYMIIAPARIPSQAARAFQQFVADWRQR